MPASTASPEPELIPGTSPSPADGGTTPAAAPPVAAADDSGDFFTGLKEITGLDLADTCASPEDALKALGQRYKEYDTVAADAKYGQQLRQALSGREQDVLDFLAGKQPAPAATPDKRTLDHFPAEARNWRYQITRDEKGNLVPAPGAPAKIVQDYQDYQEALAERLDQIARNYGQLEALPGQLNQHAQAVQQSAAQQAEQSAISRIEQQYGDWLYAEPPDVETGNVVFSDAGKKVKSEFDRISARPALAATPVHERLLLAIDKVLASQPNGRPPKPNGQARRTPGTANTPVESFANSDEEWAERIKNAREKGQGYADVCRAMVAKRAKPSIG